MTRDSDTVETKEWLEAFGSVLRVEGEERARYILARLIEHAADKGVYQRTPLVSRYRNSIPASLEARIPGDLTMEERILSIIRWNAVAMVQRANQYDASLGGHISTFASSALLYDVGHNYFFHGPTEDHEGDLIYYQGHASPGMYARAFVEGRLNEKNLDLFRREAYEKEGLSSYPHPWLMPDFWQFPTVSMGLGPLQAIYQAYFMKYLANRGFIEEHNRKVWAFLGDGETDEPESLGAIALAGREKLDNLVFVINCNLQRLDGPVRGNGKIMQELEGMFSGAGWNIIKVVWGSNWDALLERDKEGCLQRLLDEAVDGELQNCCSKDGAWIRKNFFGKDPKVLELVEALSDSDIEHLQRGGHDPHKVYAAYHAAVHHQGRPTVVLAQTVKGYGLGTSAESTNISHNVKKLTADELRMFRDRFDLPVTDEEVDKLPFFRPDENSPEVRYMKDRRKNLGGAIPQRRQKTSLSLQAPTLQDFSAILKGSKERKVSTTMTFNRVMDVLLKDKSIGKHIVPIVADEARTFGMEGLFRRIGIYAGDGQKYQPHDHDQLAYYKESKSGQILEVGINESGAHAVWVAAATSYSSHNVPMIPFYIFYSMFGFQRTGDMAWLSGDIRARGFLIGAVAGRTTLNGEGLQHEDGHSHILSGTIPNCISYDPAYGYEIAVIIQDGLRRMVDNQEDVFYYLTVMNEQYEQPEMGADNQITEGIIKGMYCLEEGKNKNANHYVQLMGGGTILNEVRRAATILREDFSIESDVWSVTSFNELHRDGTRAARHNMLSTEKEPCKSFVTQCLEHRKGPVIVATDYVRAYSEQIRAFVPKTFITLGTDGFGRSDTREHLRSFFEVDYRFIIVASLYALVQDGQLERVVLQKAIKKFGINTEHTDHLSR